MRVGREYWLIFVFPILSIAVLIRICCMCISRSPDTELPCLTKFLVNALNNHEPCPATGQRHTDRLPYDLTTNFEVLLVNAVKLAGYVLQPVIQTYADSFKVSMVLQQDHIRVGKVTLLKELFYGRQGRDSRVFVLFVREIILANGPWYSLYETF